MALCVVVSRCYPSIPSVDIVELEHTGHHSGEQIVLSQVWLLLKWDSLVTSSSNTSNNDRNTSLARSSFQCNSILQSKDACFSALIAKTTTRRQYDLPRSLFRRSDLI